MNKKSILDTASYKCTVSSVLNKDVRQHGKQFMFDGIDDTAWCSNEGTPQWISLSFEEPQRITAFSFQFQGGFAGKSGSIVAESSSGEVILQELFYPEDVNSVQVFSLKAPVADVCKIKFMFEASTDFYGRTIVYKLKIF